MQKPKKMNGHKNYTMRHEIYHFGRNFDADVFLKIINMRCLNRIWKKNLKMSC